MKIYLKKTFIRTKYKRTNIYTNRKNSFYIFFLCVIFNIPNCILNLSTAHSAESDDKSDGLKVMTTLITFRSQFVSGMLTSVITPCADALSCLFISAFVYVFVNNCHAYSSVCLCTCLLSTSRHEFSFLFEKKLAPSILYYIIDNSF